MAIKPEDVQKWNDVIRALAPTVGLAVDGVLGLIRLVRRTEGRPEVQPGDGALAVEVVAALEKAKGPWHQIATTADQQLKD